MDVETLVVFVAIVPLSTQERGQSLGVTRRQYEKVRSAFFLHLFSCRHAPRVNPMWLMPDGQSILAHFVFFILLLP